MDVGSENEQLMWVEMKFEDHESLDVPNVNEQQINEDSDGDTTDNETMSKERKGVIEPGTPGMDVSETDDALEESSTVSSSLSSWLPDDNEDDDEFRKNIGKSGKT